MSLKKFNHHGFIYIYVIHINIYLYIQYIIPHHNAIIKKLLYNFNLIQFFIIRYNQKVTSDNSSDNNNLANI